jgi:hypothetical protein
MRLDLNALLMVTARPTEIETRSFLLHWQMTRIKKSVSLLQLDAIARAADGLNARLLATARPDLITVISDLT